MNEDQKAVGPEALTAALKALGYEVRLPSGYQYGPDAMENVRFGARLATDAILERLQSSPIEAPRPMETAPKDGRMLRLLVDYSADDADHALEDALQAWTIGFNNLGNTEEDKWQFVGWCWSHDHFTEGHGKVIGWLPWEHSDAAGLTPAARDVLAERRRQVEVEGWSPEHDDGHVGGEIAHAAGDWVSSGQKPPSWSWAADKAKHPRRRQLVIAAALTLAEIERLDRANLTAAQEREACPVCAVPFKAEDLCSTDIELGTCHAACLEGSPTVDLNTGQELPEGTPIATFPYDHLADPTRRG